MSKPILHRLLKVINEAAGYPDAVTVALTNLENFCRSSTGRANWWKAGEDVYMYEWPDSASSVVTGDVYRNYNSSNMFVGKYEMTDDGKIRKFPGMPKSTIAKLNRAVDDV
jgi:hypothetical protein